MESKMASIPSYGTKSFKLFQPSLEELVPKLKEHLSKRYAHVEVSVVDCPDLSKQPFNLAGKGLGGKSGIADIGGVPYLMPVPAKKMPIYSLVYVAQKLGFNEAHILGAACVPFQFTGAIGEYVPNVAYKKCSETNKTVVTHGSYYMEMIGENKYEMRPIPSDCTNLLANVYISENKPGRVLKIVASKRIHQSGESLSIALRDILKELYPEEHVSMGGVFLVKKGKVLVHVMPNDFSKTPCDTDEKVNKWLQFFEANAPIVALSTIHSKDPGFNIRDEHTHCFGKGEGGHYHHDTTPDIIEYEGYFSLAQTLYRVDQPGETVDVLKVKSFDHPK